MIHVARKTADDVGSGVVGQQRATRGVVDVERVVDRLDDLPVAHTQPLIRRLKRELIAAARVARWVVVDASAP